MPEATLTTAQKTIKNNLAEMVPHQALHAERQKHKKTKAQLVKLKKQLQDLQQAYFSLLEQAHKEKIVEKNTPMPDPEKDIVAYIGWIAAHL